MNKSLSKTSQHLLVFIAFLVSAGIYGQSTIDNIPNQKLINNSYVSNPDGVLSAGTIADIDNLLGNLEARTTVQVAVVAVNSIGSEDIVTFSQKLFQTWGIGTKSNSNGLLLMLVIDQRTVRFHTGYGLEGTLPDIVCKRIQQEYMVPEFKNGNYDAGMFAGLQQVDKILSDPGYAEELKGSAETEGPWSDFMAFLLMFVAPVMVVAFFIKNGMGHFANSKNPKGTLYQEMRLKRWQWLLEFFILPGAIVTMFAVGSQDSGMCFFVLYLYFMFTLFHRLARVKKVIDRFRRQEKYYEIVEFLRQGQWYWFWMAVFFPVPFALYFFYHLARKRLYRNHPRSCSKCQAAMNKLSELDEDTILSKPQQMEETLKSVDYDVWKCSSCDNNQIWIYPNRSSKYTACPKCKTIAYHLASDRTIHAATYSSDGKGEQIHSCKYCGQSKRTTYTIAQLVASSSSDSSSSGGSSSSSSGGSWGGGCSGGGGASSSW